jgi:hypothetical protein
MYSAAAQVIGPGFDVVELTALLEPALAPAAVAVGAS